VQIGWKMAKLDMSPGALGLAQENDAELKTIAFIFK
jgi:hypothetical protein